MAKRKKTRARESGSVYYCDEKKRWVATVQLEGGEQRVRRKRHFKTKLEAEKGLEKLRSEYRVGTSSIPLITLEALLTQWLDYASTTVRPRTLDWYRNIALTHVVPALGKKRADRLSAFEIEGLCARVGKTRPRLGFGIYQTIRRAYRWGLKRKLVSHDATAPADVRASRPAERQILERRHLPPFVQALESEPAGIRAAVLALLSTGIRFSEMAGLTWTDLDLDTGEARVWRQLARNPDPELVPLKTEKGKRTVVFAGETMDAIRLESGRQMLEEARHPLGLVFLSRSNGAWHNRNFNDDLQRICQKAGVPKISAHCLRHTYATLLTKSGVSLHDVSRQLGHSQIALTADLYAHHETRAAHQAADRMGQIMRGTDPKEDQT